MAFYKFNEHVDVAVRAEVVTEHGAEEQQATDLVPAAEGTHFIVGNGYWQGAGSHAMSIAVG